MTHRLKNGLFVIPLLALAGISYGGGHLLRSRVSQPSAPRIQLSAMPQTHLSSLKAPSSPTQSDRTSGQSFLEVLRYVKSEFVDRIEDDRKLGFGAVRTMLVSMDDPKTRFYDPAQKRLLVERLNGSFHGIGATFAVVKQTRNGIDQRRVSVVAPAPGGPADRAGIEAGDIITEIDGRWIIAYDTRQDLNHLRATIQDEKELKKAYSAASARMISGLSLPKALDELTARDNGKVVLTVERSGQSTPLRFEVSRSHTKIEPATYKELGKSIAYLRITQFNDASARLIGSVTDRCRDKSLIVDLRDNPGGPVPAEDSGVLGSALAILNQVSPAGSLATIVRSGSDTEPLALRGGTVRKQPVIVLVNRGTSNLAELAAAAMRERGGAKLVGSKTFGDAAWVKMFNLRDGAAMTITAGKILTSKGAEFAGTGLSPDVQVQGSVSLAQVASGTERSADAALRRAVDLLEAAR